MAGVGIDFDLDDLRRWLGKIADGDETTIDKETIQDIMLPKCNACGSEDEHGPIILTIGIVAGNQNIEPCEDNINDMFHSDKYVVGWSCLCGHTHLFQGVYEYE